MLNKVADFKDRLEIALNIRECKPVELARKLQVTEGTISQYRKGLTEPKSDRLYQIATVLDVNPVWLLGVDVPMEIMPQSNDLTLLESDLIRKYRISSQEKQQIICDILGIKKSSIGSRSSKVVGHEN